MPYLIKDSRSKRFLKIVEGRSDPILVRGSLSGTQWSTLDQAIDYILAKELPDQWIVLDFDTMHIEFSRQLPAGPK